MHPCKQKNMKTEKKRAIVKSISLSIIFLCLISGLSAQNLTITGKVNKPNTLIRLFVYHDLLNWEGEEVYQTRADSKGFFMMETTVNEILPAEIGVDLDRIDFYATPNSNYSIEIELPENEKYVSYFDKELPYMKIKKATDNGVYQQMAYSEEIINSCIISYFNQLYRQRNASYLDTIKGIVRDELPKNKSSYVNDYLKYKIAATQMALNADGGEKVKKEYFDAQKVLYTQPAYMELFKEIFNNYFWKRQYDVSELKDAFWTSPEALRDYLATDPFMANNKQLAELITIYNLQKVYYEDKSERRVAIDHLEAIKESTKYKEHEVIISNILKRFSRFSYGANATDFALKDAKGSTIKLSDFKKSMVLLQFVDKYSPTSNQQFSRINELHQQWQDSVQIITISMKDQMSFYQEQFQKNGYDWQLLSLDDNIILLEDYNIRTFPDYVLIMPDTKIGMAPAPAPDQFLDYHVRRLYRK